MNTMLKEPIDPSVKDRPESVMQIDAVSKVFPSNSGDAVVALSDVSCEILKDEVCILLGPSGCGKSTLLRLMAGLEGATEGEITMLGKPVTGPGRDRGMVFQDYTSFPWLTVRQNVEYGMKLNGVAAAERRDRAEEYLRLVQLDQFAEAWPSQLSGGMRQRVAIARTLANQPSVLLMDEPFGALDAETRWHMQELLLDIRRKHRITVVMVTHDVDEAIFLADRIVFLCPRPGRIREIINLDFKRDIKIDRKEDLLEHEESRRLNRRIIENMRAPG